eukprot:1112485-Lingulodinium_polyedra.AAC.1
MAARDGTTPSGKTGKTSTAETVADFATAGGERRIGSGRKYRCSRFQVGRTSSRACESIGPKCLMAGSLNPRPFGPLHHLSSRTRCWSQRTVRPIVSGAESWPLWIPPS